MPFLHWFTQPVNLSRASVWPARAPLISTSALRSREIESVFLTFQFLQIQAGNLFQVLPAFDSAVLVAVAHESRCRVFRNPSGGHLFSAGSVDCQFAACHR